MPSLAEMTLLDAVVLGLSIGLLLAMVVIAWCEVRDRVAIERAERAERLERTRARRVGR